MTQTTITATGTPAISGGLAATGISGSGSISGTAQVGETLTLTLPSLTGQTPIGTSVDVVTDQGSVVASGTFASPPAIPTIGSSLIGRKLRGVFAAWGAGTIRGSEPVAVSAWTDSIIDGVPTVPPSVTGAIATATITQGTASGTIQTAQVFAGSGITYSLSDTLSGFSCPGMTINPANGVITYTGPSTRRGMRYLRVTATNALGSAYHDFKVFIRHASFDFVATSLAEWDAIWAQSASVLDGKIVAVDMNITDTLQIPNKVMTSGVTVTTANHSAAIQKIRFNAGGGPFKFDGAVIHNSVYPAAASSSLIYRSDGTYYGIDIVNCDISHCYAGNTEFDVLAALPEYAKGATGTATATTTSARYAVDHRDLSTVCGYVEVHNSGTEIIYAAIGNSSVVATTSSRSILPGASYQLDISGSLPTHIAVLSSTGSQAVSWESNQGLANYLSDTMLASGTVTTAPGYQNTMRWCYIHDVCNAVKGMGFAVVDNNDIDRVFQDAIAGSANLDENKYQYVTRNRIGQPFGSASYASNPHADMVQYYNKDSLITGKNIIVAGNTTYFHGSDTVQQIFFADLPVGFEHIYVFGNTNLSGNNWGIAISADDEKYFHADLPQYGAKECYIYANTITNILNPDQPALKTDPVEGYFNFMGRNLSAAFWGAELKEGNVLTNDATKTSVFADWTGLANSRSYRDATAKLGATQPAGAKWLLDQGVIDFSVYEPADAIDWSKLHPGIVWDAYTEATPGDVKTWPLRRVMAGAGTVTPGAGVEWQTSADKDGATIIQAWTSATGTVARGSYIQIRKAAGGSGLTISANLTIGNFTLSPTITSKVLAASNFVGRKTFSFDALGTRTLDLTGLTGGIDTQPREGDLVIVAAAYASSSSRSITFPADWTATGTNTPSGTYRAGLNTGYKKMTSTPDTSVVVTCATSSGTAQELVVQVYRGIDSVEATTFVSISGSRIPNPPAITTLSADDQLVVIGVSGQNGTTDALDHADLISKTTGSIISGTRGLSVMVGDYQAGAAGSYDLPAFTVGGASDSTETAVARVLALKKAA